MEQIYKSLRSLITDDMEAQIAHRLNAKESDVSQAIPSIFAGYLVLTQIHGDTPQIRNIFDEAGHLNIPLKVESVCTEPLTPKMLNIGDHFLQHILGDRAANFTTSISLRTGLSKGTVSRLVDILTPVFVGYVGAKLRNNRWSMRKLMGLISSQKGTYRRFIPTSV